MHELSIMQNILDITLEYAAKNNARKVTKIYLEIGELSGIVPDWMQSYFDFVSENTIAGKAELCIEWIPALIKCKSCGKEFQVSRDNPQINCSECGVESQVEIITGREYYLKSIEID